jgi:DNA (cytosine-5)-methyltransferase 1
MAVFGVDLFSGAGGLSCGFEQAGVQVLASVEYDPVHAAVHKFNFPLTETMCADVSNLSAEDLLEGVRKGAKKHGLRRTPKRIDVIFGGPPCQGFSTMGKRLVEDDRNKLVFHFFRLVTEIRPRYFVMENVPGMTQGGHSGILDQLRDEFRQAGYETAEPRVLNSATFGVPQDRRRLFLLGWDVGEKSLTYPEPTVSPVPKRPDAVRNAFLNIHGPIGPSVWDAIGDLPNLDDYEVLLERDHVSLSDAVIDAIEQRLLDLQSSHGQVYPLYLRHPELDPGDYSAFRDWNRAELTSSMRTVHTEASVQRFSCTVPGETEEISRFYRLVSGGLCNTLRAGTGSERGAHTSPRPIHPTFARVISVREAARLHSFPDWFRLHQTKWHGFRQVGNAVPPLLARAVAGQILRATGDKPERRDEYLPKEDVSLLSMPMDEAARHFGATRDQIPKQRSRRDLTPAG